jgi:5-hydroxyisourate hydrolase-like protein (transthyretin family)
MRTITPRVAPAGIRRPVLRLAPATLVALAALACAHQLGSRPAPGEAVAATVPVRVVAAATAAGIRSHRPSPTPRKAVGYDPRVTATDSMQALTAALPEQVPGTPSEGRVFDPADPGAGGRVGTRQAAALLHRPVGPMHVDPMPRGVTLAAPTDTVSLYARSGAVPQTPDELAAEAAASPVPAGTPNTVGLTRHVAPSCSGTGSDGRRVQAMYVHEASTPSRFTKVAALLRNEVANVDDVFAVSSRKTGGDLRVRWVHDASCQPVILDVTLPDGSLSSFDATMRSLYALGYNNRNRKYLMFADADDLCGIGTLYGSDAPTDNPNDGTYTSYARVDVNCWSTVSSVAAHELTHMLGGVQRSAPHSTPYGHCNDESDLLCYSDGPGVAMRQVCPYSQEDLLDCHDDDYFNTHPRPGSYLATHWNVARSTFLEDSSHDVRPTVALTAAQAAETGDEVRFDATSDVGAVSWTWRANSRGCTLAGTTSSTATLTCPATVTGPVTVTATATATGSRLAGSASATIRVARAAAPTAVLVAPASGSVGTPFTVSATPGGKAPYGFAWSVTGPCTLSSATAPSPAVTCTAPGTAAVSVTVRQNDGQTVTTGPASVPVSAEAVPGPAATGWTAPTRVSTSPLRLAATLRDDVTGAPLAGQVVELQVRPGGSSAWTTAATGLTTGDDGSVTGGPVASTAGWYRFSFAGSPQHAASTSATVLVKEATRLRVRHAGRHGEVVAQLTTATGRPVAGATVRLQRRVAGSARWVPVASRRTGRDGTASVRVRPQRATYYRWVFAGGSTRGAALSAGVLCRG